MVQKHDSLYKTKQKTKNKQKASNEMNLPLRNIKERIKTAKNRKISSSRWIQRHISDPYVYASKKAGYASRAAYKLIEINDKYKIIKPNSIIVDLGAAPGSWMQVVQKQIDIINDRSKIIGVDLLEIETEFVDTRVFKVQGDFTLGETKDQILRIIGEGKVHLILSDIAKNKTGDSFVDRFANLSIVEDVLQFADEYLKKNGSLVVKMVNGLEQEIDMLAIKKKFSVVRLFKPKASRKDASEIFLICKCMV